jgi:hypothetical protein
VADDTADGSTGASAQQATTAQNIAGNATDDSASSGSPLLMAHTRAGTQTQNRQQGKRWQQCGKTGI